MKPIKKKSTSSMSTRERMLQRKKQLSERGSGSGIIYPKEGTLRVRLMNQGSDKELGLEIIQFYLGQKVGGIISPATFDEPCPFMEKYQELKASKDEADQELAKNLSPRRRYIIGGTCYKDEKGKEVDSDRVCKPILVPSSVYQDIIDLYLDEDDWGDMTDPKEGYDIKISRSGSGKMDTTYSVTACPGKKPLNPKYVKEMDLEEVIRGQMKTYDELEQMLNDYLNEDDYREGKDIDQSFKKKKKKVKSSDDGDISSKKKKKKKDDLPF